MSAPVRTFGIRTRLVLLVVAGLLPVMVFAAIMVATRWHEQRAAQANSALGTVRALAIALDAELAAYVRTLQLLALETDFDVSEQSRFRGRVRRVLETQPSWSGIVVADANGKAAVGVSRGASDPGVGFVDPDLLRRAVATKCPAVSGFVRIPASGAAVTQVGIPCGQGGAVTSVLVANVDSASWVELFARYPTPATATVTLVDQNGIIVARTLNNSRWMGGPPSPGLSAAIHESPDEGATRNVGLEGVWFQSAHCRSGVAGWVVATGMPLADIEATLRGPTYGMVAIGIAATGLAIAAAFLLGRRIARPVGELADSAKALARGEAPAVARSWHMAEVDGANQAFAEAAALLRERQDALGLALARERDARGQAETANRAKDEFLAMLGHELRNPLHAISTAMAGMARVEPGSDAATRGLQIIDRQATHLTALVDDLLDVARVTSGKIVLDLQPVDLALAVNRSLESLVAAGRTANHRVEIQSDSAQVTADATRIEQIVVNLLENAFKYTPRGGAVRIRVEARDGEAVLTVSDTGEGIAPDLLPRVFDLFAQGKRTLDRAQGGLGLGLTLVRNLVELHGGRVEAHSEGVGRGARFVVRLPLAADNAAAPALGGPKPATGEPRPLRILLVDDHADGREALRRLLALDGHDVAVALDGPQGVTAALELKPDVALVDIGLPGIDGFEVARRIRAAGSTVTLVAVTGYGQADDQSRATAAGFDAFLVKPVDLNRLAAVLARVPGPGDLVR